MTRTAIETLWHDNGQEVIVPAGEPVKVVAIDSIPNSDRSTIAAGIAQYKKHGRDFVPIKIRDWYALIDLKMLTER